MEGKRHKLGHVVVAAVVAGTLGALVGAPIVAVAAAQKVNVVKPRLFGAVETYEQLGDRYLIAQGTGNSTDICDVGDVDGFAEVQGINATSSTATDTVELRGAPFGLTEVSLWKSRVGASSANYEWGGDGFYVNTDPDIVAGAGVDWAVYGYCFSVAKPSKGHPATKRAE